MTRLSLWLDELGRATAAAETAEQDYRADFARRVAALAEERAVAYRRANLVRAVAEAVAGAEDEQAAVAHGLAVLRTRLGWSSDSEARTEILSRFAPVCAAAFSARDPSPSGEGESAPADRGGVTPQPGFPHPGSPPEQVRGRLGPPLQGGIGDDEFMADPATALAAFESWYLSARGTPFWLLFENVMPETPLVDF
ncbi:hypothetical protein [Enterovirga rhinocerotis]|uniref:Uncharacterized protein n=1 Tax=Enterovirga rhinocerotis TaxID=1339210 RepID=A0A4R7BI10_9HYPH|nr:hypothetical protein [Enterovirga rhinocerotis]TDR84563.1 hypothetical protein EV668_4924 [Enterovirga rhinocerotis]